MNHAPYPPFYRYMRHLSPTPDKGNKNASRVRLRRNIGITKSYKVADGCARRITVDHSRGRARRINDISKDPQQKGGLPTMFSINILIVNVLFEQMVRVEGLEPPRLAAPEPKSGASTNFATPACNF